MTRSRISWIVICLLVFSTIALADSNTPKENTRGAIKAYVKAAAQYVAKHGPSCEEFAETDWKSGDYYIFVLGPDDKAICHPTASLIGKPITEIIDQNGKHAGEAIAAAGKQAHGGWVDYVWPRPGTDKPVPKSTYAMHVKGPDGKTYIVGSGGYELK